MKIGKIRLRIEYYGGIRYFFARPVASEREIFPARIGICQVVYIEKNAISENFRIGEIYEVYALFHKSSTQEEFDRSYCKVTITPISNEAFLALNGNIENIRDFNHAFSIN